MHPSTEWLGASPIGIAFDPSDTSQELLESNVNILRRILLLKKHTRIILFIITLVSQPPNLIIAMCVTASPFGVTIVIGPQ